MLITGVTGYVGRELASWLLDKEVSFRGASRNPSAAEKIFNDKKIECVHFDFYDPSTFAPAFDGVESLFLSCPSNVNEYKPVEQALKTAKRCGVHRIVFLSVLGCEKMPFLPHRGLEKLIVRMGFNYTFLRAGSYMQELLKTPLKKIKEYRQLSLPAGEAQISFVDSRDVGQTAFSMMLGKSYSKDAYKITGKEALTFYQVAHILSKEAGADIQYMNPSKHEFINDVQLSGYAKSDIEKLANYYITAKNGVLKRISLDTEKILQREPTSMKEFMRDYRLAFL
ncbi:NmrA family NAD(P)-binding protein [Halobacillus sp. B23F22_1]|uniref:NmrA family NAD(P)-binding protein n=1 Tax=Halobacillus sp. B23F22_1 TaxID=3459514 RepID=UPI00373F13BF